MHSLYPAPWKTLSTVPLATTLRMPRFCKITRGCISSRAAPITAFIPLMSSGVITDVTSDDCPVSSVNTAIWPWPVDPTVYVKAQQEVRRWPGREVACVLCTAFLSLCLCDDSPDSSCNCLHHYKWLLSINTLTFHLWDQPVLLADNRGLEFSTMENISQDLSWTVRTFKENETGRL